MSHIYNLENIHLLRPSVVTIGVFDGVHRGHQYLISQLVEQAHQEDKLAVVLTFYPHPDVVMKNLSGRYYLTTPDERAELLLELGVDYVVTHPFNDKIRHIRAVDFVDQLKDYLKLSQLWVGVDFALGYQREGNVAFLQEQGKQKGFIVKTVDLLGTDHITISSTLIRNAVQQGDMEQVRQWLGRGYAVAGEVVHGKKLGRTIGFPTANVDVPAEKIIPANGVYAGWAYLGQERFMAMTNVGISPTFEYKGVTVESYLLDFDRDIYGETLKVTFEKYLRPEAKFDNLDALIAQIHRDCEEGQAYLEALDRRANS